MNARRKGKWRRAARKSFGRIGRVPEMAEPLVV